LGLLGVLAIEGLFIGSDEIVTKLGVLNLLFSAGGGDVLCNLCVLLSLVYGLEVYTVDFLSVCLDKEARSGM